MNNKALVVGGLLVVALIVAASTMYPASRQSLAPAAPEKVSSDAVSWPVYQNDDYGFSFKYPPTMEIIETVDKPDWSVFRIELRNSNPSTDTTDTTGGEEITIDLIAAGVSAVYSMSEDVSYAKEENALQITDRETQEVVTTLLPNLTMSNWQGFVPADESVRPYRGNVYIPSVDRNTLLNVHVANTRNLDDTEFPSLFLDSLIVL